MEPELFEWDMRHHEALKDWMSSQAVSVLVEVLMEAVRNDDAVRVVLRCLAEPGRTGQPNAARLRAAIKFLTSVPDPKERPHQQLGQIQHRLNWMLFLLTRVLNHRIPADAIEAAEFALERSEILAEEDLDSEYWSDSVRGENLRLHRLGCERAQPDAMALAVRWARMRRSSRLGWFDDFPQNYADILGAAGLAAHQRALSPASGSSVALLAQSGGEGRFSSFAYGAPETEPIARQRVERCGRPRRRCQSSSGRAGPSSAGAL